MRLLYTEILLNSVFPSHAWISPESGAMLRPFSRRIRLRFFARCVGRLASSKAPLDSCNLPFFCTSSYHGWGQTGKEASNLEEKQRATEKLITILRSPPWSMSVENALSEQLNLYPPPLDMGLVSQVIKSVPTCMALGFFQWLAPGDNESNCNSTYTYGCIINALGRAGCIDEMLIVFERLLARTENVSVITYTYIMLWLSKGKRYDAVFSVWRRMKKSGVKPKMGCYTILIDCLCDARLYKVAGKVFKDMLVKDSVPSARTLTCLVRHLIDAGLVRAAMKMFNLMLDVGISPNEVTFRHLIDGCARAGDWKSVVKYLRVMKELNYRPRSDTIRCSIEALRRSGMEEEAVRLAREHRLDSVMEESLEKLAVEEEEEVSDSVEEENRELSLKERLLIEDLVRDMHKFDSTADTMQALRHSALEWNSGLVFATLKKIKRSELAREFFTWVQRQQGFKHHDSYTCMLLIGKLLKDDKVSMVMEYLEGEKHGNLCFSTPMFNLIMKHFISKGNIENAHQIFLRIPNFHAQPNEFSYKILIEAFANRGQGERALSLFERMKQEGFECDACTYKELAKCLGHAGNMECAYALFREMLEVGIEPDEGIYGVLINLHSRTLNHTAVRTLYEEMKTAGIKPKPSTCRFFINALKKADMIQEVAALEEDYTSYEIFKGKGRALKKDLWFIFRVFYEHISFLELKSLPSART